MQSHTLFIILSLKAFRTFDTGGQSHWSPIIFIWNHMDFQGALRWEPLQTALMLAHSQMVLGFLVSAGYWGIIFLHHFQLLSIPVLFPTREFLAYFVASYSMGKLQETKTADCSVTRTQHSKPASRGRESGSQMGNSGRRTEEVAWGTRRTTLSLVSCEGLGPGQSCFALYHLWQVLTHHCREFKKWLNSTHNQIFEEVTNRLPHNFNYTSSIRLVVVFTPWRIQWKLRQILALLL